MQTTDLLIEYLTTRETIIENTYYVFPRYEEDSALIRLLKNIRPSEVEDHPFTNEDLEKIHNDTHDKYYESDSYNSYNSSAPIIFQLREIKNKNDSNESYTLFEVHSGGDARGNYLTPIVCEGEMQDIFEIIGGASISFSVNGKKYYQSLLMESGYIDAEDGCDVNIFDIKNYSTISAVYSYLENSNWSGKLCDKDYKAIVLAPFVFVYDEDKLVYRDSFDELDVLNLYENYKSREADCFNLSLELDSKNIYKYLYGPKMYVIMEDDKYEIIVPKSDNFVNMVSISANNGYNVETYALDDENLSQNVKNILYEIKSKEYLSLFE